MLTPFVALDSYEIFLLLIVKHSTHIDTIKWQVWTLSFVGW